MVVEVLRGGTGGAVSSGIKRFNLNGGSVVLSRSFYKNENHLFMQMLILFFLK